MQRKNSFSSKSKLHNEAGSAVVEVAVLLALVAMLAVAGVTGFGAAVSGTFLSSSENVLSDPYEDKMASGSSSPDNKSMGI